MMPPHAVAYPLSRELGRPYHEVRKAVNILMYYGRSQDDAVAFVRSAAERGVNVEEAAKAEVAA